MGQQKRPAAGEAESAVLSHFGYQQDLHRTLRFFALFGISFSVISITTGIFLSYRVALANFGPASIWEWLLVGAGQLLVALVVAELGTRIPLAGYAYQWSARLVGPTYGWYVGFFGLLYMTVGGGAIFLLVGTPLLLSEFGITNPSGHLVLAVTLVVMLVPMLLNIVSVQLAAKVNSVAVVTEIVGTVVFGVLLLVLWGLHSKASSYGVGILSNTSSTAHNPIWYSMVLAGILGMYTLVGFELAADLAEEALDARRNVPKAVLFAVGGSVALGFVALLGFTVAIPSIRSVESTNLPLLVIAQYWLPGWLVKVFVAFVVFSMFSISVVGAAAQARLVFALARDNMLPFSRFFSRIHAGTRTPVAALVVFGVVDLLFTVFGYLQSNSFDTLVGATAIIPFIIYFLITVAYAFKRGALDAIPGAFSLGHFAKPVIVLVLAWSAAAILSLSLPSAFRLSDGIVVVSLVLASLWYFLALRRRLASGSAGVAPIESYAEE
ncbi:MAG: amino acid permease [Actinomycetota bacterium]|nr:amino acid permease [Actinomycetota bacterium]